MTATSDAGWLRRLTSGELVPAVAMGLVLGVMEVMVATSFAALVLGGDLAVFRGAGLPVVLAGAAACVLACSVGSSIPQAIATVQDSPAAVLAVVAAAIAAMLPAGEQQFLTVMAAVATVTTLTGLVLLVLGHFRLGGLIRYLPFPVVGGFLAGTGWLLLDGGLEVAGGVTIELGGLGVLASAPLLLRLVPAVTLGVAMLVVSNRSDHLMALPGLLVTVVVMFHLTLLLTGTDLDAARDAGWLAVASPTGDGLRWFTPEALSAADWGAIVRQAASLPTVVLVATVGLLLGTSGIELDTGHTADADRELRTMGVGNLAAGVLGGMPGYHATSLTALNERSGGGSRWTGVVMATVVVAAIGLGGGLFAVVPLFVVGGMLVFLGLGFLQDWVVRGIRRMPPAEYAIVLLILVVVGARGLLEAVVIGLAAAVLLFVVAYSRTSCIARVTSGSEQRSRVLRSPAEVAVLRDADAAVLVFELQGFVFFGTVERVVQRLQGRLAEPGTPLRHLVVDLRRLTGLDASAVLGLARIRRVAAEASVEVIVTSADERTVERLQQAGVLDDEPTVRLAPDLDHGMEEVEEALLASAMPPEPVSVGRWVRAEVGDEASAERLLTHLEAQDLASGEVLIGDGEASRDLWFVESGGLEVRLPDDTDGDARVGLIRPGTVVGELALYLGTRSAAVVATRPTRVHRLRSEVLAVIERDDPRLALAVHRMLAMRTAQRLADQNRVLAGLRA